MTMSNGLTRGANVRLLIEAIVRQVTILIAELATSRGLRAPLATVAEQVFVELARELESHGVSRPVSADMFGLALRTYLRRIRRYDESVTVRGQSLWEAVLALIRERSTITRAELLARFAADDEVLLKGILHDLTDTGLVFRTGVGSGTVYRDASDTELPEERQQEALDNLIWMLVRRAGPLTLEALCERTTVSRALLAGGIDRLVRTNRLQCAERDGVEEYRAESFVIPVGQSAGWEAGVYDHFQAVVKTILCKVRLQTDGARADDRIGGSTYTFEVWDGHPLGLEVYGQLAAFRHVLSALRERVDRHNRKHGTPARYHRVTTYVGQCLVEEEKFDEP